MTEPLAALLQVIGAGLDEASARMAKMSHATWTLQTVSVRRFEPREYSAAFSADRGEGFGAIFNAGGMSLVVFLSAPAASAISRAYLGPAYTTASERSAVAEISNIVVGALVDEIGDATEELLLLTAPLLVEGRRCDVMTRVARDFRLEDREGPLVSQVQMSAENLSADFTLVLLMPGDLRSRF